MRTDRRSLRLRRRAVDPERGAALVEFAIVGTVLLSFVFGAFEIGMAWSDSQLVTQATRTGARAAAQLGKDPAADSFTVQSIEAGLGDLTDSVTRIVVYDASAADGSLPPSCVAAGPPGIPDACSVYDKTDFGTYGSWSDGSWAPADRNNTLNAGDNVGVLVEVQRPPITGFLGLGTFTITDSTVMRIEPRAGD